MKTEIINITKRYGKRTILSNLTMEAEAGQCVGLVGANGSGKSTLFSILSGVIKGDGGCFLYGGEDLLKNASKRSELVGFVPQSTPLIEELTALDNLRLWYKKEDIVLESEQGVLGMLGIPAFLKTPVRKMSGGMKKRLSIGCAVAHHPKILLMDEPSASLDILCREKICTYIKQFKENGGTVLLATHDIAELEICDKLYILKDGSVTPFEYDGAYTDLQEGYDMKRRFTYFLLSLKSSLSLAPLFLVVALVITAITSLVLTDIGEDDTAAKIGICGDVDSLYINLAYAIMKNSDQIELEIFDNEEQALSALKSGKIHGFANIPQSFIDKAMSGNNVPLTYTVAKNPSRLSEELTREVIGLLSPVVYNSQNAVFGMRRYLFDNGMYGVADTETDKLMAKYIFAIMRRNRLFDVTVVGVSDGVDIKSYYKGAIWVLFVLLCGTVAHPKKSRGDRSLFALMSSRGIVTAYQVICEWLAYTAVVCIAATTVGAIIFGDISTTLRILPAVIPLTAMQFLIFELSISVISGIILHFFTVIISSYTSGLFYPSFFFPETLQSLGRLLPSGLSFTFVKQVLSHTNSEYLLLAIVSVGLIVLTVLIRRCRMRGGNI